MKTLVTFLLGTFLFFCFTGSTFAQFGGLKNLKNAAKKLADKEADKLLKSKKGDSDSSNDSANSDFNPGSGSNTEKSTTKGKRLSPANINEHFSNALSSINSKQWSNGRYEIKEALQALEIEIGHGLLDKMPKSVLGLPYDKDKDNVVSTGFGFVGMIVSRRFGKENKTIEATIGNESAMGASYQVLANSSYSSSNHESKSVTINGYRGTLTYDGQNSYGLGIPFGQSSILIVGFDDCSSEEDVTKAAKLFDIAGFEDMLKDDSNDEQNGNASGYVSSAKSNYAQKNLEGARYATGKALIELEILIGKKILSLLPPELVGLKAVPDSDQNIASAAGFAGVYVQRLYQSADKIRSIEFLLMDDSPIMGMMSGFLSNPLLVGMSGQKSIKVDGYKGMLEKTENSDPVEHSVNIPSNNSMLSLKYEGVSESNVNVAANKVPVGEIFKLIR